VDASEIVVQLCSELRQFKLTSLTPQHIKLKFMKQTCSTHQTWRAAQGLVSRYPLQEQVHKGAIRTKARCIQFPGRVTPWTCLSKALAPQGHEERGTISNETRAALAHAHTPHTYMHIHTHHIHAHTQHESSHTHMHEQHDTPGHVLVWHLRIMMQPMVMRGAVEKPNSSAPSIVAMATSRPVRSWPSTWEHVCVYICVVTIACARNYARLELILVSLGMLTLADHTHKALGFCTKLREAGQVSKSSRKGTS